MKVFIYRITLSMLLAFIGLHCLSGQTYSPHSPVCGFDHLTNDLMSSDPGLAAEIRQFKEEGIPALSSMERSAVEPLITISVVVHVIHAGEPLGQGSNISDEQVEDQIKILNDDYTAVNANFYRTPAQWSNLAGMPNIQFLLATVDPDGNPTNGITRHNIPVTGSSWNNNNINSVIKPAVKWDPLRYMNIYVLSIPGTTAAGGVVGFSNYPTPGQVGSDRDGPVIDYNWFGGPGHPVSGWSPISHETGHYLGLSHPFDGNSCNSDDGIADTPNISGPTSSLATLNCGNSFPQGPQSCGNDHLYVNFMDYVNENCYTSFTPGQISVMRSVLDGTAGALGYGSRELLIANAPAQTNIPGHDAGVVRIISPETINCTPDVLTPVVTIRNFGIEELSSVTINYQVDNGSLTTFSWQGNLFPGETTDVILPDFTPPDGLYDLKIFTTAPNGVIDERTGNDLFEKTFRTYFAFDPPMIETAESASAFPTSLGTFQVNFGNDDFAWEITEDASAFGFGATSFVFNNRAGTVENNPSDTYDLLVTRHFDFSEVTNAALYFDVAHADFNNLQVDTLYVLVAVGCSQSFDGFVYKKWGADLATAPPTQDPFTPTPNQWRSEGVDLSYFDGMDDVTIGFLNVSNWGNRMFIDNIRVGYDCAVLQDEWIVADDGCDADCTGEATVVVPVSNGELTYSWEGWPASHNQPTITGLCAGEVAVTITDEFGCQIAATQEIGDAPVPGLTLSSTAETTYLGSNGTATATVTNGLNPVTFSWSNGVSAMNSNGIHTVSGLAPGTYQVTITDANGCVTSSEVVVTSVCSGFGVSVTSTPVLCHGEASGTATATAVAGSGPFSYIWSNGATGSINGSLTAGPHAVTITDNNGCPAVEQFNINQPSELTAIIATTDETAVNALDGTASATVAGGTPGYHYQWSNGATSASINNLAPGTYSVTVTDDNGCMIVQSAVIQSVNCGGFDALVTGEAPTCFGVNDGQVSVSVTGDTAPLQFNWSNGGSGPSINNLAGGTYAVTVIDGAGCSAELSTQIQAPAPLGLTFSSSPASSPGANDGTAAVVVSGGTPFGGGAYSYSWSNGGSSQMISALSTGIYSVVVTDANGCTAAGQVEVMSTNCQLGIQLVATNASCPDVADGTASVTEVPGGSSPFTYFWSNGETASTIDNLLPGFYTVTITDANGCSISGWTSVQGEDTTPPTLQLVDQLVLELTDSPVSFDAGMVDNGSFDNCSQITFSISQTSFGCAQTGQNIVTVLATDANGNMASEQLLVVVNDLSAPVITCPDHIMVATCNEVNYNLPTATDHCGVASLELVSGFASGSFFPAGLTEVVWQAVDPSGNTSVCSFNVVVESDLTLGQAIVSNPACHGETNGSIELVINGGLPPYQSAWSHGGDPAGLPAGQYQVTVTDAEGCSVVNSYTLTDPPLLTVNVLEIVPATGGQPTGQIILSLSGGITPYEFNWIENGVGLPNFDPLQAPPGTYFVEVTDVNGCQVTAGPLLVDNVSSTSIRTVEHLITLFPNPASHSFSLKMDLFPKESLDLTIFDVNGKLCFEKHYDRTDAAQNIDIAALGKGVFWVKIFVSGQVFWKKLIIV